MELMNINCAIFDGKMGRGLFKALVFICSISYGFSVPIDYCLQPLNKSDCHVKPTPVFSYHKPGSRCEIEMWRGCPTANMFDDEVLCSHYCIGRLWGGGDDYDGPADLGVDNIDECRVPPDLEDCGVKGQFKYTFLGNTCISVLWRGCFSHNIYDDEETCLRKCDPGTLKISLKDELEELSEDEVKAIYIILDTIVENKTSSTPSFNNENETKKTFLHLIETETTEEYLPANEVSTSTLRSAATKLSTTSEPTTETTIAVTKLTTAATKSTTAATEPTTAATKPTTATELTTAATEPTTAATAPTTAATVPTTAATEPTTAATEPTITTVIVPATLPTVATTSAPVESMESGEAEEVVTV